MQICKVTITTTVDGESSKIVRMGKIDISKQEIRLFYREENAQCTVVLQGDCATVRREGDYSLRLELVQGKGSKGALCVGGSEGALDVYTEKLSYRIEENTLCAFLHYRLLFGEEAQDMQLRLDAYWRG